ncbi:hypothetical protein E5Q_01706 [Mixia osmundae IAM 14324]|uniref:NOT2/NOT3/NOT5 C-terminal domain-containing protein n=1 Tax=Mixia osmundae (strain CBS 9802 / IAM 14324 / JCM 22182 / KY 12970) TaxID=764103 RepID=G7DWV4_MIXOS|nr:hypothetical protein E5Q_01706 [Mixia osmundae IAM 14324]
MPRQRTQAGQRSVVLVTVCRVSAALASSPAREIEVGQRGCKRLVRSAEAQAECNLSLDIDTGALSSVVRHPAEQDRTAISDVEKLSSELQQTRLAGSSSASSSPSLPGEAKLQCKPRRGENDFPALGAPGSGHPNSLSANSNLFGQGNLFGSAPTGASAGTSGAVGGSYASQAGQHHHHQQHHHFTGSNGINAFRRTSATTGQPATDFSVTPDDFPALDGASNPLPPPPGLGNISSLSNAPGLGTGMSSSQQQQQEQANVAAALARRQNSHSSVAAAAAASYLNTANHGVRTLSGTLGSLSSEDAKRNYATKLANAQASQQQQQHSQQPWSLAPQPSPLNANAPGNPYGQLTNGANHNHAQQTQSRSPSQTLNSTATSGPRPISGAQAAATLAANASRQTSLASQPAMTAIEALPQTPAQQVLLSPADRFGLKGLLQIIRSNDPDVSLLSLGTDLSKLGLDLNQKDNLYPTFVSPWSETDQHPGLHIEPEFHLPACYNVQPPPAQSKLGVYSDETLFFIFYTSPRDVMQEFAAQELYKHNWRYHKELRLWLTKETGTEPTQKTATFERGSYVFFDPSSWERVKKEFVLVYEQLEVQTPHWPRNAMYEAMDASKGKWVYCRYAMPVSKSVLIAQILRQRLAYRQLSTAAAHAAQSAPGRGGIEPPLKGLRIVDLTRVLAGPYSTMLLADLGADVIKIEHPTRGDDTRAWYPPFAPSTGAKAHPAPPALAQDGSEKVSTTKDDSQADWSNLPPESAYFLSVNRGKRSLGLNLKTQEGQAIVKELIKKADVLVENYVPGKLAEMGLGYEDCHSINPGIIYASITGYGQTGPFRTAPGYDVMIEAEAGLMHITGEPDRAPVKVGVAITDLTTGLYVHGAIMAALLGRARTGKGAWIDASLFDSQIASLANIGSNYLIAGQEATRQGTAHPSIVPYETFATKDSFIMIGAGNDGQFRILSRLLGQPGWSDEARFKTNGDRVANRAILKDLITRALSAQTTTSWVEAFTGKGIPFAPINNIKGTFEHAQAKARGVVVEVEHARAGRIKQLAPAMYYNGQRMPVNRPPPVLAQHTAEVLAEELGYDVEKIRQLRASKTADASMTPSGQRRGTRMAKPRSALSYHEDIACPYPVVDHVKSKPAVDVILRRLLIFSYSSLALGAWRHRASRTAAGQAMHPSG